MNLATIVISIILLALFGLAIRRLVKKGTCGGCSENGTCHLNSAGHSDSNCSNCSACSHCTAEPVKVKR